MTLLSIFGQLRTSNRNPDPAPRPRQVTESTVLQVRASLRPKKKGLLLSAMRTLVGFRGAIRRIREMWSFRFDTLSFSSGWDRTPKRDLPVWTARLWQNTGRKGCC